MLLLFVGISVPANSWSDFCNVDEKPPSKVEVFSLASLRWRCWPISWWQQQGMMVLVMLVMVVCCARFRSVVCRKTCAVWVASFYCGWKELVEMPAKRTNMFVANTLQFFWFNFNFKHSANNASCKVWCVTNPLVRRTMQLCWVFCGNSNRFFYPKRCLGGVCDPKMALPKKLAFELDFLETLTRCRLPKNREEIFWAKSDQETLGIVVFSSKLLSIF